MNFRDRFPPSFADSAWAFGLTLFVLTVITAICAALIIAMLCQGRHHRLIDFRLRNPVDRGFGAQGGLTAINIYRFKISCLLTTILFLTGPRMFTLLLWREQPPHTLLAFFVLERVCSWLAALPFMTFLGSHVYTGQVVEHVLAQNSCEITLLPRWYATRDKLMIVVWSAVIAFGVTAYRVGAG